MATVIINNDPEILRSKQTIKGLIDDVLTPEVRDANPGVAVITLTIGEYLELRRILQENPHPVTRISVGPEGV